MARVGSFELLCRLAQMRAYGGNPASALAWAVADGELTQKEADSLWVRLERLEGR